MGTRLLTLCGTTMDETDDEAWEECSSNTPATSAGTAQQILVRASECRCRAGTQCSRSAKNLCAGRIRSAVRAFKESQHSLMTTCKCAYGLAWARQFLPSGF